MADDISTHLENTNRNIPEPSQPMEREFDYHNNHFLVFGRELALGPPIEEIFKPNMKSPRLCTVPVYRRHVLYIDFEHGTARVTKVARAGGRGLIDT